MGMPVIQNSNIDRPNAVTDIIESIALEEAAISHILNAEGEKLQKILDSDDITNEEMLNANNCIKSMVESISKFEMLLQSKLSFFYQAENDKKCECYIPSGAIVREIEKQSLIIQPGEPIIWNYIHKVGDDENFSLDKTNGEITLKNNGIYSIDWILNIEGAMSFYPNVETDQMSFAVEVSNEKGVIETHPISFPMLITGLVCGECLIETKEKVTIRLINYYKTEEEKVIVSLANHTDNQGSMKINASCLKSS